MFTFTAKDCLNHKIMGGWPINYHGPHKLWIIAAGPQMTADSILKVYLYLTTRDGGFLQYYILPSFSHDFVL